MEGMKTMRDAADYLRMNYYTLRNHVYRQRDLTPDMQDDSGINWFSLATLDAFKRNKRRRGSGRRHVATT